jgi:glycosyltransferase involved in cell wall biosynthesis
LQSINPAATLIVGYSPAFHRHAWRAARRLGRPVLFRGETTDDSSTGGVKHLLRQAALSLAYRSCERLLYIGERSRRHYRACGVPNDRLVFSPYCVDTTPFRMDETSRDELRQEGRAELGIAPDGFVILFSGKLSRRKGVDLLPEAIRRLPAALRERAVLLFVGDGALRAEVEALAAATPSVAVRLVGVRRQSELSRYYHLADTLVLPSRHGETWGLVVNEALHHGVPCVVSNRVGCAPDLIGPLTGITFQGESADAIGAALTRVAELAGRLDVRARCRDRVAAYTVESAAAGIATAYRAVSVSGRAA